MKNPSKSPPAPETKAWGGAFAKNGSEGISFTDDLNMDLMQTAEGREQLSCAVSQGTRINNDNYMAALRGGIIKP